MRRYTLSICSLSCFSLNTFSSKITIHPCVKHSSICANFTNTKIQVNKSVSNGKRVHALYTYISPISIIKTANVITLQKIHSQGHAESDIMLYRLGPKTLLQIFKSIRLKTWILRIFKYFGVLKFSTSKLLHLESSSWSHFEALQKLYKIHLEVKYHTSSISIVTAISIFYI